MTSGGLFQYLDARLILGGMGIVAAGLGLVWWQLRGEPSRCRAWLGYGALSLELLAAGLAIGWAVRNGSGLLVALFALGFVGLAITKASIVGMLVDSWRKQKRGAVIVGALTLLGVYGMVYLAGAFGGAVDTAEKQAAAAGKSAPVQAVDAQLTAARERLAALAGYADAGKADSEEQAIAAARQAAAAELTAARAELAQWASPDCTPKADAKGRPYTARAAAACQTVRDLESRAEAQPAAGGYSGRHTEYNGLRQHIAALETRRAELLSTGGAAESQAAGADIRLIAWVFGISTEQAAGIEWLLFVLGFDILSLFIRLSGELNEGAEDTGRAAVQRFTALLSAQFSPEHAAAILAQGAVTAPAAIPPAQVQRPEPLPALDTGGKVLADGGAFLHKDEVVLNRQAVEALEKLHPGLLDKANSGALSVAPSERVAPTCGTCFRHGSNSKTVECWYHNAPANKPACQHHAIHPANSVAPNVPPSPAYFAAPSPAQPSQAPAMDSPDYDKPSLLNRMAGIAQPKEQGQPKDIDPPKTQAQPKDSHTVYKDVEWVPPELSGKAGLQGKSYKARIGKMDECRVCGKPYMVKVGNATRCNPCATKAEESFKRRLGRAKA